MISNYEKLLEKDYRNLLYKYDKQIEKYKQLNVKTENIEISVKEKYTKIIDGKDKEISRLKALLNIGGTNADIPTSKTPINKKKIIPNTRIKSDKTKECQIGHKKHKLEKFKEE